MAKYISASVEFSGFTKRVVAKVHDDATEEEVESMVADWVGNIVSWGHSEMTAEEVKAIPYFQKHEIEDWS